MLSKSVKVDTQFGRQEAYRQEETGCRLAGKLYE